MGYYIVYASSIFFFVIGALMYLLPSTSLVRRISGTLLYICGIFLLMNSDLVVTFIRLYHQIERFKENNLHFQASLDQQAEHVRSLVKAKQAFQELDSKFKGSVQNARKEIEKLATASRTSVAMCARQLCRLYADTNKDGMIMLGPELDNIFDILRTVFGNVIQDYSDREVQLRDSMCSHPKFKDGGVKVNTFSQLL